MTEKNCKICYSRSLAEKIGYSSDDLKSVLLTGDYFIGTVLHIYHRSYIDLYKLAYCHVLL